MRQSQLVALEAAGWQEVAPGMYQPGDDAKETLDWTSDPKELLDELREFLKSVK
jgi:hypothetical protein